ncbi:sulfur oxidation c-type cytochrome SoxA [Bradyrhizobium sp. 83012]|uniref:SoxAX cytochrome complex subunit A n=1 Tax=Bradyrhizobium aeschynomenes TaxID=2734909 RepID=A0ABX2CEY6_9BRAD|nr:sulfur oxidation c-type cytochrome SoxA [Bradyrhizobium aeschynomenes]NPU10793.1 sulfur oxidation c-type cytochrome SoxA [Bradyrhizobium aeschynomenes]NPU66782.1 sulfur oxidation c-type cytochrome SoxA [Bradyrhizobium aeschynomenes]NPV24759.1 sulfur oxidation c-type cytochrome SoxA [Bradyrhizobium aeschynomenes]
MTPRALLAVALLGAALPALAGEIATADRRSGYDFMSPETKAMQDDDTANPAMLSVLDGETLWTTKAGAANKSCNDCHGAVDVSMKGVAARYPAFNAASAAPVDLGQRVNLCRGQHQEAEAFAPESRELLALTALIARQSRGMPITAGGDPRLTPFLARGRELFVQRQGQLNLACANCHDDNWDKHLAGSSITQGQPTGYPIYRLEWQGMGSLQRRLRGCMTGVRAQAFDFDAPDMIALELYLMSRARGMTIDAPAVRP